MSHGNEPNGAASCFFSAKSTTLQPHSILFWDMAAWHMAWNASVAALNDPSQPRQALRVKAQREYFALGKDFLERGIKNNPDQPQLYDALARLYRDKYHDHEHASRYYAIAAQRPGAPSYEKRFAAYELSYCEGRENEAYRASASTLSCRRKRTAANSDSRA